MYACTNHSFEFVTIWFVTSWVQRYCQWWKQWQKTLVYVLGLMQTSYEKYLTVKPQWGAVMSFGCQKVMICLVTWLKVPGMSDELSLGNFKSRVFHLLAWLLTEGEGEWVMCWPSSICILLLANEWIPTCVLHVKACLQRQWVIKDMITFDICTGAWLARLWVGDVHHSWSRCWYWSYTGIKNLVAHGIASGRIWSMILRYHLPWMARDFHLTINQYYKL